MPRDITLAEPENDVAKGCVSPLAAKEVTRLSYHNVGCALGAINYMLFRDNYAVIEVEGPYLQYGSTVWNTLQERQRTYLVSPPIAYLDGKLNMENHFDRDDH
jgi:hypothetical protein